MMKKHILILLLFPIMLFSQHDIKGVFSPAESFTFALLYKSTPEGASYINQSKIESDGSFVFNLDQNAQTGIYKIVYAIPPEDNNFEVFYNGREHVTFHFDLDKGLSFSESSENILWHTYTDSISKLNGEISKLYASNSPNKTSLEAVFKTLDKTQDDFEKQAANMMVLPFVKSNKMYVPKAFEDVETYSVNLMTHYFDAIDFGNPLIQSSDFLINRVEAYVFAMPENENAYKKAIDHVVKAVGDQNSQTKIYLLETLWQHMLNNNQASVATYISDTYLLPLAKAFNRADLEQVLVNYNKTAIGKKATDFKFTYLEKKKPIKTSLYEVDMPHKGLLIFWSSTCSHCLQELPKVKAIMEKHPDVKVIAYGLEDGVLNWKKTITDFPGFIHTYDLGKWDSPLVEDYGVQATPSYFILDSDKTILAKPEHAEDLEAYFQD